MNKLSVYSLPYRKKELHSKIRDMFNDSDLEKKMDSRGYVIEYVLNDSQTVAFISRWSRPSNTYAIREKAALNAIEQVLSVNLERQFKVGRFCVDGYDKESNTAYEIDEEQHFSRGKLKESCLARQKYIEGKLKCKFVRIKV